MYCEYDPQSNGGYGRKKKNEKWKIRPLANGNNSVSTGRVKAVCVVVVILVFVLH